MIADGFEKLPDQTILVKRTISHSVQQLQKLCLNYQWVEARYHEQKIKTRGHKIVCHLNGITTEGWSLTKRAAKQLSAENMLARIEDWCDRDECKYGYKSLDQGGEDNAQGMTKLADVHPVPQLQHLCQVYAWARPQYQSSYENFKKDICRITCTVNGFKTSALPWVRHLPSSTSITDHPVFQSIWSEDGHSSYSSAMASLVLADSSQLTSDSQHLGWGPKKRVAKFWAAVKMLVHLEENQDCEQFSYGYQVPLKTALEQTNVETLGLEEISNVPKKVSCHSLQSLTTEEEVFENHFKENLIPESNGETNVIVKNDVEASSTLECKKDDSIFPEFKEDVKIMKNYCEDARTTSESEEDAKIMKNSYEDARTTSESEEDVKIMKNFYEDARTTSESEEDAKITQEYDEDASIFVGEGNVSLYPIWFKTSPSPPEQEAEGRWRLRHKKLENTKHLTILGRSNSRVLNELEQKKKCSALLNNACTGESCTNRLEIGVDDDLDTVV
uniref:(California timema) hypothetical protein n=1 Tax=Timema californicum TaxID=61474 RepID=A0A7R9PBK6_TIMCA|nr:unnamed protein product [Timema californicum]